MSKTHILKLDISHGSDRHEISMFHPTPPTVGLLLDELEKKTRVPLNNIQLIFKGQKLHYNLSAPLSQFGIFSGSRLLMVGEKLSPTQDAVFRRILGIGRDIGLIEKTLLESVNEFSFMETGGIDRTMINEYLPQLNKRVMGIKNDLQAFLRVITEIEIDSSYIPDVKRHQTKNNIQKCDNLLVKAARLIN